MSPTSLCCRPCVPEEPWWYHQHLLEGNELKSFCSPQKCLNVPIVLVTLCSVVDSIIPESVDLALVLQLSLLPSSFPQCAIVSLLLFPEWSQAFAQGATHSSAFAPTKQCSLRVWERREGQSLLLSGEADEQAEESKDSIFIFQPLNFQTSFNRPEVTLLTSS